VSLTGDRRLEILLGIAHWQPGSGIADLFQILQMAMSMPGLAFRCRAKDRRYVVVTLDVRL